MADLELPSELSDLYQTYVEDFNVQPAGLIVGKNFALIYNPLEIKDVAVALIRLADAQGDDWHTDQSYAADRTMFARVVLGKFDNATIAWFRHEQLELATINSYLRNGDVDKATYLKMQRKAHLHTLKTQENNQWDLYHPTVVKAYDDSFGPIYPRK